MKVHRTRLALREVKLKQLEFQRDFIEVKYEKLIAAMLTFMAAQNVLNAPFTEMLVSAGPMCGCSRRSRMMRVR
jgi:hypothetical protein